jgi:MoxR-like ATPase
MAEMKTERSLTYTGQVHPPPGDRDPQTGQLLYPYLPNPELLEAVNLAIYLRRPLLLKGEPGCGKTQLARAVAYELGLPFKPWYVKSTSRAQDGLYLYDAVGRLRDAQLAASNRLTAEQIQRADDPATYITWGPLGEAFRSQQTTVVLIDEIDKADIDFPNDLLFELEQLSFEVRETRQLIQTV